MSFEENRKEKLHILNCHNNWSNQESEIWLWGTDWAKQEAIPLMSELYHAYKQKSRLERSRVEHDLCRKVERFLYANEAEVAPVVTK